MPSCCKRFYLRGNFNVSYLKSIVEGISCKRTVALNINHGYLKHLKKSCKSIRQNRRGSVERIACFGIHKDAGVLLFEQVVDVAHKRQVADELLRGDTTDLSHKPILAHKAIGCANDIECAGIQNARRDLKVNKA